MEQAKYLFGDIVVVDGDQVCVVVKTWERATGEKAGTFYYEVYVRSYNSIQEYEEDKIVRYRVRHKELDEQELEWQNS